MKMSDAVCPYCGTINDIGISDEIEGEIYEKECKECEKSFAYSMEINIIINTSEAPCLNGEPHKYEKQKGFPPELMRDVCAWCGDIKRN